MAGTRVMETYAARLASFSITYPSSKKRNSDSKGAKSMKWRHKSPAPAELARAGFFYRPTPSNPDNAQCFLCEYNLDGWEEDDDAIVEHLKHSPDCGWAIIVNLEAETDSGNLQLDDPLGEKLLNAREMTFGSSWPHETRKGWVCKTQKMIESGWYYSPMEEGDDFVRCSYCSLALDGWERKDNPFDEHQRRSPECRFFSLVALTKPKAGRPRKSRISKGPRKSTQSNFSILSDEASVVEGEVIEDRSGLLDTNEIEKSTKAGRGRKKAAKPKKPYAKSKTKVSRTEVEEPPQTSSYIEPEDDDFEVKIEEISSKNAESKKRSSDEMNEEYDTQQPDIGTSDIHSQPPVKRRATRIRSTAMGAKNVPTPHFQNEHENDTLMTDAEGAVPPTAPASKKSTKRGRKRASSTVRKASTRSTASVAPLRGVPDNDTLDAALEADLDRPLTDDEDVAMQLDSEKPKTRRLTRTRPSSRIRPASVANMRRSTRSSNMTNQHITADEQEMEAQDMNENAQPEPSNVEENHDVSLLAPKQDVTGEVTSAGALSMQEVLADHAAEDRAYASVPPLKINAESALVTSKASKGRQPSRYVTGRNTRVSVVTNSDDLHSDLNSSVLLSQTGKDDSGHETDVSVVGQGPIKRKGKKGKSGKKAVPLGRNIDDIIQPTIGHAVVDEQKDASNTVAIDLVLDVETDLVNIGPMQETSQDEEIVVESTLSRSVVATPISLSPIQSATCDEAKKITSPVISISSIEAIEAHSRPLLSPNAKETPMKTTPAPRPAMNSIPLSKTYSTPRIATSPQSSDAENQPPSSRPSATRPPIWMDSPSLAQITRIPLASTTPTSSPSKRNASRLQSSVPWTAAKFEQVFLGSPIDKDNPFIVGSLIDAVGCELRSPEKRLSVEEWVQFNAKKGEARLRKECERIVGKFEGEGIRALRTLEGIACVD